MNVTPTREGPRINEEINVVRVRLVDERGGMVGVVGRNEALTMAADAGLDLVEIAPGADPPVCKILDFKFKCTGSRKKNPKLAKQKSLEARKSESCAPSSRRSARLRGQVQRGRRVEEGDKVKGDCMRFRGARTGAPGARRQMCPIGCATTSTLRPAEIEQMPRMEGAARMTMVVSPKGKHKPSARGRG
jgi:translation initiation factor IF-3